MENNKQPEKASKVDLVVTGIETKEFGGEISQVVFETDAGVITHKPTIEVSEYRAGIKNTVKKKPC